jgi:hypothetical protein
METAMGTKCAKTAKGYGKIWSKEEVDTMLRIERELKSHPRMAMQMTEHLPGKTLKQIRDKRKEASYKTLLRNAGAEAGEGAPRTSNSGNDESDHGQTMTDLRQATTEDGGQTEQGAFTRQRRPALSVSEELDPIHNDSDDPRTTPVLLAPVETDAYTMIGAGEAPSNDDRVLPPPANEEISNPYNNDQQWRKDVSQHALSEGDGSKISDTYKDLYTQLISILTELRDGPYEITQTRLDEVYSLVVKQIGAPPAKRSTKRRQPKAPPSRQGRKRKKKRYLFARTQDLFRKSPNLLARYIREGIPWLEEQDANSPGTEEVQTFYNELWGTSTEISIPFAVSGSGRKDLEPGDFLSPITARDLNGRLNRLRKHTAPGPDGIERKHLTGQDIKEVLRLLFNVVMMSNLQPKAWNANRTILIPKQGKDHSKVENYRPLTIGSLICRLYWGLIDQKLRDVITFSPRQQGFVYESGCFNNVHILHEALRAAKSRDGMAAVQLDITKAFDTVPHRAIDAALQRLGLPKGIRESIMNSYNDLHTSVQYNGANTNVKLKRGVKQGDPLSPFIFNAVMNPLLEQLEQMDGFEIDESHHLSALAFADDLILLASTAAKVKLLLRHTEAYLSNLGMKLSAGKCASFEIIPFRREKTWYLSDPGLRLASGESIPASRADDQLCYLGGNVSPWAGLQYRGIVDDLQTTLGRCKSAHLKPHQKLTLITTHIIPHFLHRAVLATAPISTLRAMDQEVRNSIKTNLHLPMSTPNGLLYCGKRDGGLGVPKFQTLVTCTALKQGLTLLNSLDPTTHALLRTTQLENRLKGLAAAIRLAWPVLNFRDIEAYKRRQKAEEVRTWSALQSKGKAVQSFVDDRYGNAWLYNPTLLKPSRFLSALRLRGGMTSDKVTMSKITPQTTVKCRKCKLQNETLAHILGQCMYTKVQRIRRHNEIRDIVSHKLAKQKGDVRIIEEANIPTPQGNILKPDLVVVSQGRVHVIDVTIRHEDEGYLEEGFRSKTAKYSPLLESLAVQLQAAPGRVLPLVVGTRGCMPKKTLESLQTLNIEDRSSYITIALTALRHSIETYHAFIDYNVQDT